ARQVASLLTSWRQMAKVCAFTYADADRKDSVRAAVEGVTIAANDSGVTVSGKIASDLSLNSLSQFIRWSYASAPGAADAGQYTVCHQGQPLRVRVDQLAAHLASGDRLGPCR